MTTNPPLLALRPGPRHSAADPPVRPEPPAPLSPEALPPEALPPAASPPEALPLAPISVVPLGAPPAPRQASGPPPAAWPIVPFTLVFGVHGAISAARRASKAGLDGVGGRRYWRTFVWALVGHVLLGILVFVFMVVSAFLAVAQAANSASAGAAAVDSASVMSAGQLENEMLTGSDSPVPITAASCEVTTALASGAGSYHCQVAYSTGAESMLQVTVAADGSWVARG